MNFEKFSVNKANSIQQVQHSGPMGGWEAGVASSPGFETPPDFQLHPATGQVGYNLLVKVKVSFYPRFAACPMR